MTNAHTPGPWHVDIAQITKEMLKGRLQEAVWGADNTLVAICGDNSPNVHLVASAPRFLAAAQELCARHDAHARTCNFERCGCENCSPFRAIIEDAIGGSHGE